MSSCAHIDNEEKYILIFGEVVTQGLDDTTLTAEAKYPINSTQLGKKIHTIMKATVSYLVMLKKYISLKQTTLK